MTDAVANRPLTQRIRNDIEHKILTGAWPPGHHVPSELALQAEYGCARMTVNRAMTSLVEAGLIKRRRRSGSIVAEPKVHSAILDIPDIKADIEERGKIYAMRTLASRRRLPGAGNERELLLAGRGDLLDIRCVHLADGHPFALEERLISLASVPDAASADLYTTPPGTWLLGHVPWTEAEHRISAVAADGAAAATLEVPAGHACLLLERRSWRGAAHITYVRQIFPGDAYDLIARFTPSSV